MSPTGVALPDLSRRWATVRVSKRHNLLRQSAHAASVNGLESSLDREMQRARAAFVWSRSPALEDSPGLVQTAARASRRVRGAILDLTVAERRVIGRVAAFEALVVLNLVLHHLDPPNRTDSG